MTKYNNSLIISPHIDDAVLSLGGAILNYPRFKPDILNVFSKSMYRIGGLGNEKEVTLERYAEEQEVTKALGLNFFCLELEDSSLRSDYLNEHDYMNPANSSEKDSIWLESVTKIQKFIDSKKYSRFFFPLSCSGHIDHRIVFEVGKKMMDENKNVIFYEEIGYETTNSEAIMLQYIESNFMMLNKCILTCLDVNKKIELLQLYRSQTDSAILSAVHSNFLSRKGERIWGKENTLQHLLDDLM